VKRTTDFLTEYSLAYDSDRDTLWFSNSTNMHTSLVGPQVSRLSLPSTQPFSLDWQPCSMTFTMTSHCVSNCQLMSIDNVSTFVERSWPHCGNT